MVYLHHVFSGIAIKGKFLFSLEPPCGVYIHALVNVCVVVFTYALGDGIVAIKVIILFNTTQNNLFQGH
jgi:Mn2+/Fe2+ NRAMP family transporter